MSKIFMKKNVIMIIAAVVVTVMLGVIIGTNVANTLKAKEKRAEKAKLEQSIAERKETEERIEKAKSDKPSEEEHISEEYKEYEKKSDEEKAQEEVVPRKEKIDFSELEKIREDQKEDLGKEYVLEEDKDSDDESVLPKKFNLKDKITIPIRDQDSFGLCWDYASVKVAETNLALTQGKYYDLSESHIDYMTSNLIKTHGRGENNGGNFSDFKHYNDEFKGFVLEDEVPRNVYEDYEYNTFSNIPKEDLFITKYVDYPGVYRFSCETQEEYELKLKELQTAVKTHVMNYGALYASIDAPDFGENHYVKYGEIIENSRGAHAVVIVGWDDNFSKDNFTSPNGNKPEKDGAYIAINSWGEDWGDNGYFYISYEDRAVNGQMSGIISINDKSDLIKVSELVKDVRDYIHDVYADKIITLNGEEYVRDETYSGNIDLSNRNIKDLSGFEILLRGAYTINLSNNNIENIDALKEFNLSDYVSIDLSNNNIKDVSCLKDMKINSLNLSGNYGVTGYDEIKIEFKLILADCGLTSFDVTDSLKDIDVLDLSGNKIDDYSNVTKLNNLYYFTLENSELTSLESIKDIISMETLDYLDLAHNNLKDISGLEDANIYSIDLSYNTEIADFEPLRKSQLTYRVILNGCDIKDAKDVLMENVSEADLEKYNDVLEGEYDYDESQSGIRYDLSYNKNISNIKALKNASSIVLNNCDLTDISELKELKYANMIELSGNPNITGDLSGMDISELEVRNCDLNNDFNVFNVNSVGILDVSENNIDNYDSFIDKVKWSLYIDTVTGETEAGDGVYISTNPRHPVEKELIVEVEIPNEDGLKLDIARYIKSNKISPESIKVNGKAVGFYDKISINKNTTVTYSTYSADKITIKFVVNDKKEQEGIEVAYNPYMARIKNATSIEPTLIKVIKVYGNGVYKETNEFEVDNTAYRVPSKIVKRRYTGDHDSYILVDTKYFSFVKQGEYTAKFTVSLIPGAPVKELSDLEKEEKNKDEEKKEEEQPEENVVKKYPKLTFTNEELYRIAKSYWGGLYFSSNDLKLILELNESRERNNSGIPMYIPRRLLYDVGGMQDIISTDIYILMDMENGMDRIEEEDLKVLENFDDLKYIHIVTPPEEYNQLDLIIDQDKYIVNIEQKVE